MNNEEQLAALQTYFDLMSMNGGARLYRASVESGIIAALAAGPATPASVATACGLQERPVGLLLDGLCSLGVATRGDDGFALAPVMQLLSGNYKNLGDEYWDHLPVLLKTGVPIARMDDATQSEALYQKQVTALAWMMKPSAEAMAMSLGIGKARKGLNILDVGAGSAIWSLTLAAKDPASTVTALDWPAVLKVAEGFAQQMGVTSRFTTLPGNCHDVALPDSAFDLAIVANVTHIETPEGNIDIFRRVHRALRPGGELAVIDVLAGQPRGDLSRSLYAMGLALRTEKGHVYSREELESLLTQAAFPQATFHALPVPPFTMGILLAKKSA